MTGWPSVGQTGSFSSCRQSANLKPVYSWENIYWFISINLTHDGSQSVAGKVSNTRGVSLPVFNFTTHSVNHKLNVTVGLLHHRGFDCFTAVGVFLKSVCFCSRSVFKCVIVSFKEPFSRRSCFKEWVDESWQTMIFCMNTLRNKDVQVCNILFIVWKKHNKEVCL